MTSPCPCGRLGALGPLPYPRCCGRYLDDPATRPPDAETLMRSRYTAYVLRRLDWLRATWDPATRPAPLDLDPDLTWTGLEVTATSQDGDRGRVSFTARWRTPDGTPGVMREDSRFVRRGSSWFYVDGVIR